MVQLKKSLNYSHKDKAKNINPSASSEFLLFSLITALSKVVP